MIWSELWMDLFGSTAFCGIDMGFWVAMSAVLLIVILMNVVFWSMKPKENDEQCEGPLFDSTSVQNAFSGNDPESRQQHHARR